MFDVLMGVMSLSVGALTITPKIREFLHDAYERIKEHPHEIAFDRENPIGSLFELTEKSIQKIRVESPQSYIAELEALKARGITAVPNLDTIENEVRLKNIKSILTSKETDLQDDKSLPPSAGKRKMSKDEQLMTLINIIRQYYAWSLAENLNVLRLKVELDANAPSQLENVYKIGLLQGELNLIDSLSDMEIKKILRGSLVSEQKSKDHEKKRKEKSKQEEELNKYYSKYLKYAEEKWSKEKAIIYHAAMADRLIKKYPELKIDRKILVEKLRPIARKYRYSDFSQGEFKTSKTVISLCQSLNNDRYGIRLDSPDNTIERLNEVIRTPDFYSKWFRKNKTANLSPEAASLVTETKGYRKKKFSELTEEEQANIKRLNRLLLEHTYPMTPMSLEHGLMRGWKGKKS